MPSYEHNELVRQVETLDSLPPDYAEFSEWIKADNHLRFLEENALSDELVIYGSGQHSFIHSIVVPQELLETPDQHDLLGWSCDPFCYAASYVSGGGREGIWIERGSSSVGSKILEKGTELIYRRTFEGWTGKDRNYFELLQEFSHLENLHWRPEQRSYCRYDNHGDLEHIVSATLGIADKVNLVSFKREPLEVYLAASDQLLVRLFDFTLLDLSSFTSWGDGPEQLIVESDDFFYRQKILGLAAYTRGVQIVRPSRSKEEILSAKRDSWHGNDKKEYVEFIVHDWRHGRISKISAAPNATTSYMAAHANDLPFDLSPAFFKSEVLLKYKADKDKYQVTDRDIYCRVAWYLRDFDVNEAGQVHAYICDLRRLPYSEQLHWLSYNEEPKAQISRRAVENDFLGRPSSFIEPLREVQFKVRKWNDASPSWWCPRDEQTIARICVPHTSSRDEWAEAFLDLTKLVHEGFLVKPLRKKLSERDALFDMQAGSIVLLEKLVNDVRKPDEPVRLKGLRMAQYIRTKTKGHTPGREAENLANSALQDHETFANHFRHICVQIYQELELIEETFNDV